MLLEIVLFIIGIPLLWKGAEWLVDGGAAIARRFGLSLFVIGLTVVSFGTSAPELIVNVLAALDGQTSLAFGTILGSNIANTTLILGIAALIRTIHVSDGTFRIGIPFTALITITTLVLLNDDVFERIGPSQLGRGDAIILLVLFIVFMWYIAQRPRPTVTPDIPGEAISLPRAITYTVAGMVALALGGEFLVNGANEIATAYDLTGGFVGFAIVAVGTSLPELAASAAASWKSQVQLVVGNIIGSNIFNLLWILGITALIEPIPLDADANLLILGALGSAVLLWLLLARDRAIGKARGAILLTGYALFLGLMAGRIL